MENDSQRELVIIPSEAYKGPTPVGAALEGFIASTVTIATLGAAVNLVGGHLLCKAKIIKNYITVPAMTAIGMQLKNPILWSVAGGVALFDGRRNYKDAQAAKAQFDKLSIERDLYRQQLVEAGATPDDVLTIVPLTRSEATESYAAQAKPHLSHPPMGSPEQLQAENIAMRAQLNQTGQILLHVAQEVEKGHLSNSTLKLDESSAPPTHVARLEAEKATQQLAAVAPGLTQ